MRMKKTIWLEPEKTHQCTNRLRENAKAYIKIYDNGEAQLHINKNNTQVVIVVVNWCPFCGTKVGNR